MVSRIDKMKMVKATGSLPENSNFGIKASTIKTFLSANGMTVRPTVTKRELSTERIAEIAKRRTVMVVCLR